MKSTVVLGCVSTLAGMLMSTSALAQAATAPAASADDSTADIKLSIREVVQTLIEAMILVIIVMFVFLQSWTASAPFSASPITRNSLPRSRIVFTPSLTSL